MYYHDKRLQAKVRKCSTAKTAQNTHLRFAEDGSVLEAKASPALVKVKCFLDRAADNEIDKTGVEESGMDTETSCFSAGNQAGAETSEMQKDNSLATNVNDVLVSSDSNSDSEDANTSSSKCASKPSLTYDEVEAEWMEKCFPKTKKKRQRKQKGTTVCVPMPAELEGEEGLRKYWEQRYSLFSRFDDGIKMDRGRCHSRDIKWVELNIGCMLECWPRLAVMVQVEVIGHPPALSCHPLTLP